VTVGGKDVLEEQRETRGACRLRIKDFHQDGEQATLTIWTLQESEVS
jgi:hypothetical protein